MSEILAIVEQFEKAEKTMEKEYTKIDAPNDMSIKDAKAFFKDFFNSLLDNVDLTESENPEENLEKLLEDYFDDLKNRSEFPDTLPDKPFSTEDLERLTPEEVAERREEFDEKKAELKKQWELENGRPWPKYETDVYSSNDKLIRKAGNDYDAHHIQPLCMGGKNEAKNITPLHAQEHYDKQGVHSPDSPYSNIEKYLGGN